MNNFKNHGALTKVQNASKIEIKINYLLHIWNIKKQTRKCKINQPLDSVQKAEIDK